MDIYLEKDNSDLLDDTEAYNTAIDGYESRTTTQRNKQLKKRSRQTTVIVDDSDSDDSSSDSDDTMENDSSSRLPPNRLPQPINMESSYRQQERSVNHYDSDDSQFFSNNESRNHGRKNVNASRRQQRERPQTTASSISSDKDVAETEIQQPFKSYQNRPSRSADNRGRFEKRTRSRSVEIRLKFAQPPVDCGNLGRPLCQEKSTSTPRKNQVTREACHSNWNQCYEPVDPCCTSEYSRESSKTPNSCPTVRKNTTVVYCPEPYRDYSSNQSGGDDQQRRYYCDQDPGLTTERCAEDQYLKKLSLLNLTVMNRRRASSIGNHMKVGKTFDNLRRSNPYDPGNEGDGEDDDKEEGSRANPLSQQRYGQNVETRGANMRERDIPYAGETNTMFPGDRLAEERHNPSSQLPEAIDPYSYSKPFFGREKPEPHFEIRRQPLKPPRDTILTEQTIEYARQDGNNYQYNSTTTKLNEHTFPFVGVSPSGNLKIDPRSITFENPKAAVLVSNLGKVQIKNEKMRATSSKDQLSIAPPVPPFPDGYLSQDTNSLQNSRTTGSTDFLENIHHRMMKAIDPDTKVIIGDKKFPCHHLALQCYSKYFDKHHRPRDKIMEFKLPQQIVSAKIFPNLMDWILVDEDDKKLVISKDNVVGLFSAADFLGIPILRTDCLDFIRLKVAAEDPVILKMYEEASDNVHCVELLALISTKLSSLFPKLYNSRQFLQMNVRELVLLLDSDTLNIKSELEVYDAAARWLLYDWTNHSPHTVEVMETVRFGHLTPVQLTQIQFNTKKDSVPDYGKIFANEKVKVMVENGLKYSVWREQYKAKPGELNKWLTASGIPQPKSRFNLENALGDLDRMSMFNNANDEASLFSARAQNNAGPVDDSMTTFGNKRQPHKKTEKTKPNTAKGNKDNDGEWMDLTREENRIGAAILIQSRVRGWLARIRYKKFRSAITKIQSAYRIHRSRPHTAKRIRQKSQRLRSQRSSTIKGIPVKNLTLPECASVILLGGNDPIKEQGQGENNTGREVYQLHPINNTWSKMGQIPEPRVHGGAVLYSGFIIFFGGADPRYKTSRDKSIPCATTWSLQIQGGNWRRLADMNTPRSNFGYVMSHGKIFVFGGVDIEGNALPTCEAFNPELNEWSEIASMDGPRLGVAVTNYAEKIWVIGGLTKDRRVPILKSVIVYDMSNNSFSPAPALIYPRAFSTATTFYTKIFLFAGAGKVLSNVKTQSLDDVSVYDKGHWESVARLASPRHGQCQVKIGKYMLLIGGINSQTQEPLKTCEVFNMIKYTVSTKVAPLPKRFVGCCGLVIH